MNFTKFKGRKRKLPEVISLEELNKILKVTKKPHHKLAFKLGFLCGLRVSEVVKLRLEDIDYSMKLIRIKQAKGEKDRNVPLPKPLIKSLKDLPIKCGIRALQVAINKKSLKAINRKIHFHTLRHSCATYLLSQKMNIRQVQQLLGHTDISTTSIYLHINPQELKNKFDEIWGK